MNWIDTVTKYATVWGPVAMTGLAFFNRSWLRRVVIPHLVLAAENEELRKEIRNVQKQNAALQLNATGWHIASEGAIFTRDEAENLLGRVEELSNDVMHLKEYVPKFAAALEYIKSLFRVINEFQALFRAHNIDGAIFIPAAPTEIEDDLNPQGVK